MKQINRKLLPAALVQALGAGVALTVVTTAAHAQQAQRVEKIEVTGSNIKRVDQETVAPIEIITRDQIERTGQATVAEVLRNIPSNTGGSFGESFANSFASGAAGISLRGE
jgi:iron complex outermembrane receptor protein